jgi:predicted DNA-binding transcriptional regulator YafY
MLRKIPRYPNSVGTREIRDKLAEDGFQIDVRTIQRDLGKLSVFFPLASEEQGKARRWCWAEGAKVMDIPGMESPTALAFRLAEEYLVTLLPQTTLRHLEPHFRRAKEVLKPIRGNRLGLWPGKVIVIGRGPDLMPPSIKPEVQDVVYRALLNDRQIEVTYKGKDAEKPKSYPVNPLGLVFRDGVVYLVGTAKDYADVRHFVLHRVSAVKLLDTPCRRLAGFDLTAYVKEQKHFAYPVSQHTIELEALFEANAAVHLTERPLSKNQRLTSQKDGRVLLQATVKDSLELHWWLLGFGDKVEVLTPKALREEFATIAQRMASHYESG